MKIDGVWQMSGLSHYGRDLNFGVAPPPLPEEQAAKVGKLSWCGGWSLAIPTASRNKQAAWEFIRFMTGDRARRIQAESERAIAEAQGYLYMPGQCSVAHLNEEFYRRYVRDNPEAPQKYKDGMATFNDLLPYSRFRPVTPVGQRLWNAHNDATENALFGKKTPREALNEQAAVVQRDLDNLLHPSAGRPIRSWRWFFVLYGGLLAALCAAVFVLDTRPRARAAVGRILPWVKAGGVVEGARGGYFRKQWREGILCALPWIVGFVIFTGGPMLFSIVMSFCDYDVIKPPRFVGLDNYAWMFQKDGLFGKSLHNTAFMVVGIPVGMALSLSMALLLNLNVRGIAVWRTFFYLPAIVPLVAGSILWIWIFNPQGGLINKSLEMIGVAGPKWLGDENWAKPSLILMGLWGAGGGMIIWLAGLKGINQALYEAAAVDGAGPWQRFLHVTIPQLTPYIFFNLVMGLIHTFQIFGQAFIMTQGGPANSTLFYVYHLFNNAFRYGRMGYASAMAWVLFVILLVLTIVNLRLQKHWVYYEQE
jgi:multiple sugar transport system permease protein